MTARPNSDLALGADTATIDDIRDIDWMPPPAFQHRSFGRITVQPYRSPAETVARSSIRRKVNCDGNGAIIRTESDRLETIMGKPAEHNDEANE